MGNVNSLCSSIKDCETKQPTSVPSKFMSSSLIYEKKSLITESFKMNSDDLKISHQELRRFLLSKLKKKCSENEEYHEYYEFYKGITKDRMAFESIYWLFSIKWIEYIQMSNNATRNRMCETATSVTSLQNLEKDGGKMTSSFFVRFFVEEIFTNNYKITQIIEKFRATFFKINQKLLEIDQSVLEDIPKESLDLLISKLAFQVEHFLIDPLKDFLVFFYSNAFDKIVFSFLNQDIHFMNQFILDIIHHLTFKSQNRIYNLFSNLLTLANRNDILQFRQIIEHKMDFSLVSLLEGQEFLISDEVLLKVEEMNFFDSACKKLLSISDVRTPLMKLETIAQIQTEIFNALSQINEAFNLEIDGNKIQSGLNADHMLSLFCYVLVKSRYFEICKEIKFIEKFVEDDIIEETQWGCLYETMRSAVAYVLSLGNIINADN